MESKKVYVVIPNWNGANRIKPCLDSLVAQSQAATIVVVDNGSVDNSLQILQEEYSEVILIKHKKNKGFAGGVNAGIKLAIEKGAKYVALLNNDAVADKDWLKQLVSFLERTPNTGIVTSKITDADKKHLDSTGDLYTVWGLAYPRGRGEPYSDRYDSDTWIFGASGGASLYRIKMLEQIGLFDEDFFAYYEDVDISFRAQLAGWKIAYEPKAEVYHEIGATSSQIKGFTTYHTLKNLPLLFWKNVPHGIKFKIWIRLVVAWSSIAVSAIARGQIWPFIKACVVGTVLWPKKLIERNGIQKSKKVSADYIDSILTHDLPPNAHKLRSLRAKWWRLRGKA